MISSFDYRTCIGQVFVAPYYYFVLNRFKPDKLLGIRQRLKLNVMLEE